MSNSSPKRSSPAPSRPARAEFNWPPTDEELADCFYSGPPSQELASRGVEALQETVSDGAQETSLSGSESEASNTPCTSGDVGVDLFPADSAKSEVQDSTSSDIAVFAHEAAPDGAGKTQWAAEIAHLQALIEALTEKVEWRIPNDTRR
jgi:hypothetical protein